MPVFIYEATDNKNKVFSGFINAANETSALLSLKDLPLPIKRIYRATFWKELILIGDTIPLTHLMIFTRELTAMIKSGVQLLNCLKMFVREETYDKLKLVILRVIAQIQKGASLSTAFSQHPNVFSQFYLALIRAGEMSGELPTMMERLTEYLEWEYALRTKIKAAMIYPFIVFISAVLLAIGVVLYIFPIFISMFEGFNMKLPLLTHILVVIITFLKQWAVLLSLAVGLYFSISFLKKYLQTSAGKLQFHSYILKIPRIGSIISKLAITRFCNAFATLYGSGLPLLMLLDAIRNVTGNELFDLKISRCTKLIAEGTSLKTALESTNLFPPAALGMIEVGENTGELHSVLTRTARFYDFQVNADLSAISSIIEPLLIFGMGLFVGIILIATLLPIYKLMSEFTI